MRIIQLGMAVLVSVTSIYGGDRPKIQPPASPQGAWAPKVPAAIADADGDMIVVQSKKKKKKASNKSTQRVVPTSPDSASIVSTPDESSKVQATVEKEQKAELESLAVRLEKARKARIEDCHKVIQQSNNDAPGRWNNYLSRVRVAVACPDEQVKSTLNHDVLRAAAYAIYNNDKASLDEVCAVIPAKGLRYTPDQIIPLRAVLEQRHIGNSTQILTILGAMKNDEALLKAIYASAQLRYNKKRSESIESCYDDVSRLGLRLIDQGNPLIEVSSAVVQPTTTQTTTTT